VATVLAGYIAWTVFLESQSPYLKLVSDIFIGAYIGIILSVIVFVREYRGRKASLILPRIIFIERPKVEQTRLKLPVVFVSRSKRLSKLANTLGRYYKPDIVAAGFTVSPYGFAATYVFYTLVAVAISIPTAIVLAYFFGPPALALMVVPALVFATPKLKLIGLKGERKRSIEDELPFFTLYASIMQMAGYSLYQSFMRIIGEGVFKHIEKDALLMKRNAIFFTKDNISAIESIGRTHPNENMRMLLLGYTSQLRSGGDLSSYLQTKVQDLFSGMKFKWQRYAGSVTNIGEMMVSLFFILPTLIITMSFVFPSGSSSLMTGFTLLAIPMLTAVAMQMITSFQPKTYNILSANWKVALFAGIGSVLATYSFNQLWASIAAGLIAAATVYGITITLQLREISSLERALPQFVRDITEFKKMGYDIRKAFIIIAKENKYTPTLDLYIKAVATQMQMGTSMRDVKIKTRSWLTNLTFFLFGEVIDSGGGSPAALESMSIYVSQTNQVKRETHSSMRLYDLLAFITPVGLAFTMSVMLTLLRSFASTLNTASATGILGGLGQISGSLIQMTNILIVIAGVCMGIIAGKSIDFTAKSVLRVAIAVSVAVISLTLVGPLSQSLLGGVVGASITP
jgi:flagellar protein FlaJ